MYKNWKHYSCKKLWKVKVMRRNKVFDFLFKKQYVIAGCLVLCAGVGMTALYSYNQKQEQERLEQQLAENEQYVVEETQMQDVSSVIPPKESVINRAVEDILPIEEGASMESDALEEGEEIILDESMLLEDMKVLVDGTSVIDAVDETTKNVSLTTPSLHFPTEEGLFWPMDGNVIMNYSMDATIYHATLDQYKYNPAIIIAGDVNNKVYSVAKGKIVEISQNEVTGTTVTVDLGDGYKAIYGQLKELNFDVGDYLESGHVIGYVSEPTKYYALEGSNLYFELQKDGKPIDPIAYFE